MKKILILLSAAFLLNQLYAQTNRGATVTNTKIQSTTTGSTYALIIGINYTGRKNFSQLHYAVNDADLLKSFLQSGIFFDSIPDENIKIIRDKDATAAELGLDFDWLQKKAKKGDRAIIYFAGHGVASDPSESYLIAYDAPDVSDPSQFSIQGGAIPIQYLKIFLEKLRNNGVVNYLITDACRSNEQKDSSLLNFQNIFEANEGEIQFSSCSRNQSSMEDTKWGGGHGLFTYYLIKGLCGDADKESEYTKDGKVSLEEIKTYVEKHVSNDSRNLVTNKAQQIPYINISNADDQEQTIAYVKPGKAINQQLSEDNLIAVANRGMNEDTSALYKSFITALEKMKFFDGEPNNAYSLLNQIKSSATEDKYQDAAQEYIIHLLNDAQVRINKYFEGIDTNYTYSYFSVGAKELNIALSFMPKEHPLYKVYTINRLFLEARSLEGDIAKYDLANAKIDSALALDSTIAYLYNAKGLFYMDKLKWNAALSYFDRAHNLRPAWSFPIKNIAVCYSELNEIAKAKEIFYDNIKIDSLNVDLWDGLGYIYYKYCIPKNYDSAVICFKRAIQLNSKYKVGYIDLGNVLKHKKQYDLANTYYLKAVQIDSNYTDAYSGLGNILSDQKKYELAKKYYRKALQIDSDYKDAYINLGVVFDKQKKFDSAKYWYLKAIQIDSDYEYPYNGLGYIYGEQKKYDSGKAIILKAIQINPGYADGYANLGNLFIEQKKYDSARLYFFKAIVTDYSYPEGYNGIGYTFYQQKKYDSAKAYYFKAIQLDSNFLYAYINLGDTYIHQKEYDSAKTFYFKTIQIDRSSTDAYIGIGNVFDDQKKYDSAEAYYRTAILLDSGYEYAYNNLGNVFRYQKQFDSARIYYLKAIKIDNSFTEAYNNIGGALAEQKQYDSAKAYFLKAISTDSGSVVAYSGLGNILDQQKKYDSAKTYFFKAIQIDSNYATAYNNLGFVFNDQRKYDSAQYYYHEAIQIDSTYSDALNNIGNVYFNQQQYDSSKFYYLRAIQTDFKYIDSYYNLGQTFYNQKQYDFAKIYYLKTISIDSNYVDAYNNLGLVFYRQSHYDLAKANFYKALGIKSNYISAYYNLGAFFYEQKQYDSAKFFYLKAFGIDSNYTGLYSGLGDVYFSNKEDDSAIILYKKALLHDSLDLSVLNSISTSYYTLGKEDTAATYIRKALNAGIANAYTYTVGAGISGSYFEKKLYDKAIEFAQPLYNYDSVHNIPEVDTADMKIILEILAFSYLNLDQLQISKYYYKKDGEIFNYYYDIACLASLSKKTDEAIKNLELSFKNGYDDYNHLKEDTDLDNIRNTDEYKQLLKKYFPDK